MLDKGGSNWPTSQPAINYDHKNFIAQTPNCLLGGRVAVHPPLNLKVVGSNPAYATGTGWKKIQK